MEYWLNSIEKNLIPKSGTMKMSIKNIPTSEAILISQIMKAAKMRSKCWNSKLCRFITSLDILEKVNQ
jgi:hypothetical protein